MTVLAFPPTLKVGDAVVDGPNKGWIYCEDSNVKPFLVAPNDSGVMKWREAMSHADCNRSQLPNKDQLNAMYKAREAGSFRNTFNLTGANPSGWYWSATQNRLSFAWCQSFRDGFQEVDYRFGLASVRCVRQYSPLY